MDLKVKMFYINLILLISFLKICNSNHVSDRFFRNIEYRSKSVINEIPFNEIPTLSTENPMVNKTELELDDSNVAKNIDRRYAEEYKDIYRISLSAENPSYKVLVLQKDSKTNQSILFINTFVTYKDNLGYPFSQRRSADQIYFYPEVFQALVLFLFNDDKSITIKADDIQYIVHKQSSVDSFFHLTILMKIPINPTAQVENLIYKYRGIWLNLREYQFLLSRSSQILRDLNV